MKVLYIRFHCLELRRGAGILGLHRPVTAPGIYHMTTDRIVTFGAISDFPRIDVGILVVIDQTLNAAVKMNNVGVTYLFPSTASGSTGERCMRRISAAVTSRPSGVAVQWRTKYCSFAIFNPYLLPGLRIRSLWQLPHPAS